MTGNTSYLQIDRKAKTITEAINTAPIFKKQGLVHARPAIPGEKITTILKTGAQETENIAKKNEVIVTNPSGEQYIISMERFLNRYEMTPEVGKFSAKGFCRAILNPFGKPIEIMASWGTPQTGDENCLIADTCDASGQTTGEPYLIDGKAFAETYIQVAD